MTYKSIALGINIDHVATLRQARRGRYPDPVHAALELPYSTGPVEGHVNRIKLLKRQGYGRAKFDLLRQRVLLAA